MFESASSGLKLEVQCALNVGKNSYKYLMCGNESSHQSEEAESNLVFVELNTHECLI